MTYYPEHHGPNVNGGLIHYASREDELDNLLYVPNTLNVSTRCLGAPGGSNREMLGSPKYADNPCNNCRFRRIRPSSKFVRFIETCEACKTCRFVHGDPRKYR